VPNAWTRFRLREYVPADLETLYEIDQACYAPEIAYSRRELRGYLRLPGADCVVAELEGERSPEIAGFCVTVRAGAAGYVVTIDVLEACRRRGVGAALLAEVERRLAANGVREVQLETASDNASTIAFWHKHGYRKTGVIKGYYPGGRDAFSMTKDLS
jgi:ribosomal-protein-alanine N-acetyltransferase